MVMDGRLELLPDPQELAELLALDLGSRKDLWEQILAMSLCQNSLIHFSPSCAFSSGLWRIRIPFFFSYTTVYVSLPCLSC